MYGISSDKIPFADDTQLNATADGAIAILSLRSTADGAAATPSLREINNEDDIAGAGHGEASESVEPHPGFAPDTQDGADVDDSPGRGGADTIGAEERNDDSDNETDPKGCVGRRVVISWDLYGDSPGVIDDWGRRGSHGYKHHVTYDDPDGEWPNYDDTHRWHDLGDHSIKWRFEDETPPAAPFTGGQRPTRERREPDRFSLATLIAAYTEVSGAGFSVSSLRVSSTALYVNLDGQADRIAERARGQAGVYLSYGAEIKDAYLALPPEAQICACIAVDHDDISAEYGACSPQAALMREVYAAAAVAAA